jgi:hypothetical protein
VAAVSATHRLMRPKLVTALLLVAVVTTAAFAYTAPAYTEAQPQRRYARVLIEPDASTATYEVASQEPGLDLDPSAPQGWYRATDEPAGTLPFGRFQFPYVFRTTAPSPGPAPAAVTAFAIATTSTGSRLTMTIVPQAPGLSVAIVLPDGVRPARSSLPGIMSGRSWRAAYVNVSLQGLTWEASFASGIEQRLASTQAVVLSPRFPGGSGWQSLPPWLPQQHAVWHLDVLWVLKLPAPVLSSNPAPSGGSKGPPYSSRTPDLPPSQATANHRSPGAGR